MCGGPTYQLDGFPSKLLCPVMVLTLEFPTEIKFPHDMLKTEATEQFQTTK